MKYMRVMPALLAAGMICVSHMGIANAYFTTYVTAKGGYEIAWHKEKIEEVYNDWTKTITISSEENSIPVYVRAKAFAGSTYELKYMGKDWTYREDGYYYYNNVLNGGETTSALNVIISKIPIQPKQGENFNVIVIYETTPVQYDEEGNMIACGDADWNEILSTKTKTHDIRVGGGEDNE